MNRNDSGSKVATDATAPNVGASVGDKLRHIGVSLLPLGLFVGGALGYEQLAAPSRGSQKPAAAIFAQQAVSKPAAPAPKQSASGNPAPSVSSLRDGRSLMDLVPAAQLGKQTSERQLELILGNDAALPLAFDMKGPIQPGVYAVLRGVPQNASLSHGIAVGSGSWLIDGGDLSVVKISMRSGATGPLPLELSLLSRESRTLAQERVTLVVTAARSAPVPVHIVPPTPLAMPASAPPISAPTPDVPQRVAQSAAQPVPANVAPTNVASPPAPINPNGMRLAVSNPATIASDGRPLVRLAIEPSGTVPDGAYVVLRGVPERSAMSRGISIGPDVWLLTLLELGELELRLPDISPAALTLGAKLVTSDGKLLAEEVVRYEHVAASGAVVATNPVERTPQASAAARAASAAAPARPVEVPAAQPSLSVAPQPQRYATVTATPPPEPSRPGARVAAPSSTVATKPAALDVSAQQVALARGRKMLQSGNIAIARALLERAASAGSAEAAALLGVSYDAEWLRRSGVLGISGDAPKATRWFEEARRMGAADVDRIIAGLARR